MDRIAKDRDHWVLEDHFRMRGLQMSRIETFTDAAFAFALTLLVVSLDVPETYADLKQALFRAPAFAASFAILMFFWWGHHRFSRRFGLEDGPTVTLSCLLVFIVLIYVYPLKFVFGAFATWIGWWVGGGILAGGRMTPEDLNGLFVIYGLGFFAMSMTIAWLNWHALRRREDLELNTIEVFDTHAEIRQWTLYGSVGLLSVVLALLIGQTPPGLPGFAYMILPVVMPWQGLWYQRKRIALLAITTKK